MNNTLSNGLALLQHLANNPVPHKVSDLAEYFSLPQSNIHRLLQTLVKHFYVEKIKDKKYQIGVGALRLGHALLHNIPLRNFALPILKQKSEELKCSLTLSLPFNGEGIVIAYVSSSQVSRGVVESTGTVLNSYASASGKLFLAYMDDKERIKVMKKIVLKMHGPNTHQNLNSLKKDLSEILKRKYSLSILENGPAVVAMAVPIFKEENQIVASIGLSANETSMSKLEIEKKIKHLEKIAQTLEKFYSGDSYAKH